MKKIALFSLFVCVGGIYAVPAMAGSCGTQILNLDGAQKPGDDEFLYTSKQAQTQAKSDYDSDKEKKDNMKNGQYNLKPGSYVLECDKEQCVSDTVVFLPNRGIVAGREEKYFWCQVATLDDRWEPLGECSEGAELKDRNDPFRIAQNSRVMVGRSSDYGVYNEYDVLYAPLRGVSHSGTRPCVCNGNKEVVVENGKKYCRSKGEYPKPEEKQCPFSDGSKLNLGETIEIACDKAPNRDPYRQDARTGKKCYKSCLDKSGKPTGFWSIKECIDNTYTHIDYTSSEKSLYKPTIPGFKRCKKKSSGGSQSINPNQPVVSEQPAAEQPVAEEPGVEETQTCIYRFNGAVYCADGKPREQNWELKLDVSKEECDKEGKRIKEMFDDQATFTEYTEELKKYAEQLCADYDSQWEGAGQGNVGVSNAANGEYNLGYDYLAAEKTLNKFVQDAESNRSVWKNAEGKFNTTRLASDITAGVVLGTVGGVVTGVIIKKNQVKKGFEALNCSVGGQKVADWGDEFSVGLQR